MKLAALLSGGKDSIYSIYLAKKLGYEIKYLITIMSENPHSYMFHTSNIGLAMVLSEAMERELVIKKSLGEKEIELNDLESSLKGLNIDGVVCGAIQSNYQKSRVEKICKKLSLKLLSPLWECNIEKYMNDLIENKFEVIITAVSAQGFDKSWLGRKIDKQCLNDLLELNKKYKINIAGEGGEFETLVIDCPLFKKKIEIIDSKINWDEKTESGELVIKDAELIQKD